MNKKLLTFTGIAVLTGSLLYMNSCVSIPKGAAAVTQFDSNKYLGKWYEIARLDFTFEKNLNNTTADYSLNEDHSIQVVNRGYDYIKKEWKEAIGKAKFTASPDVGRLKVSFFGPFYSGYNVVELDDDYQYALVVGKSPKYCWILSREKTIPDAIKEKYVQKAGEIGVNTDNLVWVEHN